MNTFDSTVYNSIENWSFWKLEKIKIPNLKLNENSIFNQAEETIENSEIEQIQSKLDEPKIELPIDESPKLLFKPGKKTFVCHLDSLMPIKMSW